MPKISPVFTVMVKRGGLEETQKQVNAVTTLRAAHMLPICDIDYVCFD